MRSAFLRCASQRRLYLQGLSCRQTAQKKVLFTRVPVCQEEGPLSAGTFRVDCLLLSVICSLVSTEPAQFPLAAFMPERSELPVCAQYQSLTAVSLIMEWGSGKGLADVLLTR